MEACIVCSKGLHVRRAGLGNNPQLDIAKLNWILNDSTLLRFEALECVHCWIQHTWNARPTFSLFYLPMLFSVGMPAVEVIQTTENDNKEMPSEDDTFSFIEGTGTAPFDIFIDENPQLYLCIEGDKLKFKQAEDSTKPENCECSVNRLYIVQYE